MYGCYEIALFLSLDFNTLRVRMIRPEHVSNM